MPFLRACVGKWTQGTKQEFELCIVIQVSALITVTLPIHPNHLWCSQNECAIWKLALVVLKWYKHVIYSKQSFHCHPTSGRRRRGRQRRNMLITSLSGGWKIIHRGSNIVTPQWYIGGTGQMLICKATTIPSHERAGGDDVYLSVWF